MESTDRSTDIAAVDATFATASKLSVGSSEPSAVRAAFDRTYDVANDAADAPAIVHANFDANSSPIDTTKWTAVDSADPGPVPTTVAAAVAAAVGSAVA